MDYSVYENVTSLQDYFNATLMLQDLNISAWNTTNGTQGLWLGLGYAPERSNADATVCSYNFTNSTEDRFQCFDVKWTPEGLNFTNDTNQDLLNFTTLNVTFDFANQTGNFSVLFIRPFLSNDTSNDTNLTATLSKFVWAYGFIENSTFQAPSEINQGTVELNLAGLLQ